ncbi:MULTISPECIES: TetR/AcrR family transcriptional regulator [unclassified Actinoplanes]|uniref:TetR/AcrR family transcriptional regulator n=1 Tax=unclassified Actinoplanes TaxID=2626549 RepID=UPI0018D3E740|nr:MULTISPECIES: TetR family transcriptional regulator C-terminal domain-containing protein [unclassified Actinoplanes]
MVVEIRRTKGREVGRPKDPQRRQDVADAARRAVVRDGLTQVRLRSIADEAGLTAGAVLYYYGNVDALLIEVYHQGVERWCVEREALVRRHDDARLRLRECIETGVADGPDDELGRLLMEFTPRVLHDPTAARLDGEFAQRQADIYAEVLNRGVDQGHFRLSDAAELLAATFVAIEDGRQLDVLSGRISRQESVRTLVSYARAVTSCHIPDTVG